MIITMLLLSLFSLLVVTYFDVLTAIKSFKLIEADNVVLDLQNSKGLLINNFIPNFYLVSNGKTFSMSGDILYRMNSHMNNQFYLSQIHCELTYSDYTKDVYDIITIDVKLTESSRRY